jgi:hypothetical protein
MLEEAPIEVYAEMKRITFAFIVNNQVFQQKYLSSLFAMLSALSAQYKPYLNVSLVDQIIAQLKQELDLV